MTILQIEEVVNKLEFITIESPFQFNNQGYIVGEIGVHLPTMKSKLIFLTEICPSFPYKSFGIEPIHFYNKNLLDYPHIMEDGAVCYHLDTWETDENRLESDFYMLKNWVEKYYISETKDPNYEHIVVEHSTIDEIYYALHFTQLHRKMKCGEFGYASISNLRDGLYNNKIVKNLLLQNIKSSNDCNVNKCKWNNDYMGLPFNTFPYVFLSSPPCICNKFIIKNYEELNTYLDQEQINFLHRYESVLYKNYIGKKIPFLLAYSLPNNNIHWVASILTIGSFPTIGYPEIINGSKTGKWLTSFKNEKIYWAMSFDSSHELYFGRGSFEKELIDKKILIIGIGAVGSIVAKTLARCGCTNIALFDFDIKKPENICRSEYEFITGATNKTSELSHLLSAINPHLNIEILKDEFEAIIKGPSPELREFSKQKLDDYDIIFDCSTDNDLMNILEKLTLKADIINLSITNHATGLVCGFSPNISRFVKMAFNNILQNDATDLYRPTGCWSPTFKASYNDIALMVHYSMRHIHKMLCNQEFKQNFILQDTNSGLKITKY